MVSMIHHADAIVRDAPPVPEFIEYPKCMVHPGFMPASIGTEVEKNGFKYHVGGTPVRFPPVMVNSADQEEYHEAQGYVSQGKSDPAAFSRLAAAAMPANHDYQPVEFPKWAGGVLVNNPREEAEALAARREQLAIKPDAPLPDTQPAALVYADSHTTLPWERAPELPKAPDEARLEALEGKVEGLADTLGKILNLLSPKPAEPAPLEATQAAPAPVIIISRQQKAANTRRANAEAASRTKAAA